MPPPAPPTLDDTGCTTNTNPSAAPPDALMLKLKNVLNVAPGPSGMRVVENAEPDWPNVAGVTRSTPPVQAALPFSCNGAQLLKFVKLNTVAACAVAEPSAAATNAAAQARQYPIILASPQDGAHSIRARGGTVSRTRDDVKRVLMSALRPSDRRRSPARRTPARRGSSRCGSRTRIVPEGARRQRRPRSRGRACASAARRPATSTRRRAGTARSTTRASAREAEIPRATRDRSRSPAGAPPQSP